MADTRAAARANVEVRAKGALSSDRVLPLTFGPSHWEGFEAGIRKEWLVTNGIGGYASSSLIGANTRKYHGLLVVPLHPPRDRWVLLAKIEDEIGYNETIFQLSTNQYRNVIHPLGYRWLSQVSVGHYPTFYWVADGIHLKKEIFMVYGKDLTVIRYTVLEAPSLISLHLHPLLTCRGHHRLLRAESRFFEVRTVPQTDGHHGTVVVERKPSQGNHEEEGAKIPKEEEPRHSQQSHTAPTFSTLYLYCPGAEFYADSQWYYNFQYVREKERGLDFEEDLFHPGTFTVKLHPGEEALFLASTAPVEEILVREWEGELRERASSLTAPFPDGEEIPRRLALATDPFLVKRKMKDGRVGSSILAGYPWFGDWGRDTFVALPGLTLVTRRFQIAKEILQTYAGFLHKGLIPNHLSGTSFNPRQYNSIDASLWYIYALYKYWRYTEDQRGVEELAPAVEEILTSYLQGTLHGIGVKEDGLLYGGDEQIQLTWMDAKVSHWVVTPRDGAAVEINALWYNALRIAERIFEGERWRKYGAMAANLQKVFEEKFWSDHECCLYDRIKGEEKDSSIRPNQVFAAGLPFPVLTGEKAALVVKRVLTDLYAPLGFRTLSSSHSQYKGTYQGDRWLRDGAYHQGTVWPWLLGPFITAYLRVHGHSQESKEFCKLLFLPFLDHLKDAGVGSVSEIFWGDPPHNPSGCIAQAWSVAELLRAYCEDYLEIPPGPERGAQGSLER